MEFIANLIQTVVLLFPFVFTNNLVMQLVKFLGGWQMSRAWLRGVLGMLSILGAISASSLSGDPVDFDSLTSLGKLTAEALILGVGAHFSYRAISR